MKTIRASSLSKSCTVAALVIIVFAGSVTTILPLFGNHLHGPKSNAPPIIAAAASGTDPPILSLSPNSGTVGQTITVTGSGYTPSTTTTYKICLSDYVSNVCYPSFTQTSVSTDGSGAISTSFVIPQVAVGLYYVEIIASSAIVAEAAFAVNSFNLALSPNSGPEGTSISVSASNLQASGFYDVCFSTSATSCTSGTGWTSTPNLVTASGAGTLSTTAIVPDQATQGNGFNNPAYYVDIYANGAPSLIIASQQFVITPETMSLSANTGIVGQSITVTGSGFASSTSGTYGICFSDYSSNYCYPTFAPNTESTSGAGGISSSFVIPQVPAGLYYVEIVYPATSVIITEAAFAVNSFNLALSPNSGPEGTSISVTANNLVSGGAYEVCFSESATSCVGGTGWTSTSALVTATGGSLSTTVTVPDQATQGSGFNNPAYYVAIYPNGGTLVIASAQFVITPETISLSPNSGSTGTTVTVSGTGYAVSTSLVYGVCFSEFAANYCYPSFTPALISTTAGGAIASGTTISAPASNGNFVQIVCPCGGSNVVISSAAFGLGVSSPPTLSLSAITGIVGQTITVTGTGYTAGTTSTYSICFSYYATSACYPSFTKSFVSTDGSGAISTSFVIPEVPQGLYFVQIISGSTIVTSAAFAVNSFNMALSPNSGPEGTSISVTANNLVSGGAYEVCFSTSTSSCSSGTGWTSTSNLVTATGGSLSTTVSVPNQATQGSGLNIPYYVDIYPNGGTLVIASAQFVITPETVSLSANTGIAGQTITVTGAGLAASTSGTYTLCFSYYSTSYCYPSFPTTSVSTSGGAGISSSFTIPQVPAGLYNVQIVYPTTSVVIAAASFAVNSFNLALSPNSGPEGTSISVSASNLQASGFYDVCFSTSTSSCSGGTGWTSAGTLVVASGTGTLSTTVTVPSQATQGSGLNSLYYVDIYFNSAPSTMLAAAQFVITPETIAVSPNLGGIGTSVAVTATGYAASTTNTYAVCFSQFSSSYCYPSLPISAVSTSAGGAVSTSITVPAGAFGAMFVEIVYPGTNTIISSAAFQVPSSILLTPNSGIIGSTVTIQGSGFAHSASITVTWDSPAVTVQTTTSDTNGLFSTTFTVPTGSAFGSHTVTAKDSSGDSPTATYTVNAITTSTTTVTSTIPATTVTTTNTVTSTTTSPTTVTSTSTVTTTSPVTTTTTSTSTVTSTTTATSPTTVTSTVTTTSPVTTTVTSTVPTTTTQTVTSTSTSIQTSTVTTTSPVTTTTTQTVTTTSPVTTTLTSTIPTTTTVTTSIPATTITQTSTVTSTTTIPATTVTQTSTVTTTTTTPTTVTSTVTTTFPVTTTVTSTVPTTVTQTVTSTSTATTTVTSTTTETIASTTVVSIVYRYITDTTTTTSTSTVTSTTTTTSPTTITSTVTTTSPVTVTVTTTVPTTHTVTSTTTSTVTTTIPALPPPASTTTIFRTTTVSKGLSDLLAFIMALIALLVGAGGSFFILRGRVHDRT